MTKKRGRGECYKEGEAELRKDRWAVNTYEDQTVVTFRPGWYICFGRVDG